MENREFEKYPDPLTIKVDNYIRQKMAEYHIPGLSIAVLREDQSLLIKGYGLANVELAVPATEDTIYEIASITKPFTATAVMLLAEDGLITIDDSIGKYLPNLPEHWQPITIRHILAHQSGIKSYTAVPEYWKTTRLDVPQSEILGLVNDLPLDFEPGERHAYDNTGYYLLGLLIEAVSGEDYGAYLNRRIFAPLNMTATGVNNPYGVIENRAAGYTYKDEVLKNAEYYSPSGTFSAGILLSSVRDLAKWATSFYASTVLNEDSRKLMWTAHKSAQGNEKEFDFSMGLGWFLVNPSGRYFAGHNGSIVGFTSSLSHFLEEKLTVVTLCNMDTIEMPHEIGHGVADYYVDSI